MQITPYTKAYYKALLDAINRVCAEERWMQTAQFELTPAWNYALKNPTSPSHLILLACDETRDSVGWCRLFPTDVPKESEIGIGLLAPYRDQELGTQLLQQTIAWALQHNLKLLTLSTHINNRRAIHVFEKVGFNPTGQQDKVWMEMTYRLQSSSKNHLRSLPSEL